MQQDTGRPGPAAEIRRRRWRFGAEQITIGASNSIQQAPGRDFLYDNRDDHHEGVTHRQPLGNPALGPATLISYEAGVKHLISERWALQGSLFYRDVYDQIGAREVEKYSGWSQGRSAYWVKRVSMPNFNA